MKNNLLRQLIFMTKLGIVGALAQCLFLTVLLAEGANAQAKMPVSEVYCNLGFDNKSLAEVFKTIEKETNYKFSFYEDLDLSRNITITQKRQSLKELLLEISAKTQVSFRQVNSVICTKPADINRPPKDIEIIMQSPISGTVTSIEDGSPLPGVTVRVKNTNLGTITDVDGNYSIDVPTENAKLIFSFIGFITEEIEIGNQSVINLVMVPDIMSLEEIVVVGFGTQKRSDIVGSISSISSKTLSKTGETNILNSLQGAAAGLRVQNSSSPGTSATIRVRGLNSLNADNSPLIIVDGVPFDNMRAIDPNDIESIEVLKDASAAAIYGSQAANGVLLITTKRATGGETQISANISYSIQNPALEMDLMNGEEYLRYKTEVARTNNLPEDNILSATERQQYLAGVEVDPYEMMLNRNAPAYEAQVSLSGGSKTRYYVAGNYSRQDGLINTTFFERYSFRANLDAEITDAITLSNSAFVYQYNTDNVSNNDFGRGAMYRLSPYSVMRSNGQYTINPMPDDPLFGNPLGDAYYVSREDVNTGVLNNTVLRVEVPQIEGLGFEARYSVDMSFYRYGKYAPGTTKEGYGIVVPDSDPPQMVAGKAQRTNTENRKWYFDGLITYKRNFGNHNIDLTGMYSAFSNKYQRSALSGEGFTTNDYLWYNIEASLLPLQVSSSYNLRTLESQMFRANYNFDNRYYATFTVRRDGYSGFSDNQKYAVFPSGALAWRIDQERFMQPVSWVDNLKLRVSYGLVGNQAISPYQTLASLTNNAGYVFGKSKSLGYRVNSLETNLKWETTSTFNLGLDYGFFRGRLFGSVEAYNSVTSDLLVQRSIPSMMGSTSIWDNSCKVLNRGLEFNLTGVPVQTNDFRWELTANISYNHNEILEIYGEKKDDIDNRWFIGQPIGVLYRQVAEGIWQEDEMAEAAIYGAAPGHPKIKDMPDENGEIDYKIDAADRTIVGQTVPDVLAGLSTTITYKGLSLTVNSYGAFGAQKEMTYKYLADGRFRNFNFQDYWTPENPSNSFPRPGTITGDDPSKTGSLFVHDADWIRIKNISLSYTIPNHISKKWGISSLSVYTSLQDYFTFTNFPFVDPETGSGIGSYPNSKQWKTGLRINL